MGSGFYGEDLAHIHGEGFGQLAAAAAGVVMQHIRERWQNPMVLDVGCGAGALSNALVQAGCRTWGIDISEAFVRMARARLPHAEFKLGSFFDVELPRAHAICAIGEVINYLADNNNSLDTLRRFFERAHTALEPGGLLLFDAAAPGRSAGGARSFVEGKDWAIGTNVEVLPGERLLRRITTFRAIAGGWRRSYEEHYLRLWSQESLTSLLQALGFEVECGEAYGVFGLLPGWVRYSAQKIESAEPSPYST